jgi:hypothetical protein
MKERGTRDEAEVKEERGPNFKELSLRWTGTSLIATSNFALNFHASLTGWSLQQTLDLSFLFCPPSPPFH